MNQTSAIAASLVISFLVFITVRGELPAYLAVMSGRGPAGTGSTGGGTTIDTGLGITVNVGGNGKGGGISIGTPIGKVGIDGGGGYVPETPSYVNN